MYLSLLKKYRVRHARVVLALPSQCRERWMHHLDPSLRHVSWTPEEDQLLITLEVNARGRIRLLGGRSLVKDV